MEAPGVPRGAAPVRGPPSSCAAQSGAGAQAPLFPPLLSALAVPSEADLGSPRGPGSTLHPGSTTSGTSRDQGHVQDGHAPCPDRPRKHPAAALEENPGGRHLFFPPNKRVPHK